MKIIAELSAEVARWHVAQAAQLLDRDLPGWYDRIDLDDLDLGSCSRCIIGQVYGIEPHLLAYGEFRDHVERLCGSALADVVIAFVDHGSCAQAWRELIAHRQAVSAEAQGRELVPV